jgi:NAD(P)H-nitrite reductase large subunit
VVTLREEGWRGRIPLLGAEPDVPFGQPPLSKTYLRGEEDLSAWLVKPADWYSAHTVEFRTGVTDAQVDTAQPLADVLGEEVAGALAAIHREQGVQPVTDDQVIRLERGAQVERANHQ